jgi:hypothetical protein
MSAVTKRTQVRYRSVDVVSSVPSNQCDVNAARDSLVLISSTCPIYFMQEMLACTGMGTCYLFKWSATDTAGRCAVLNSGADVLRPDRCCSHGELDLMLRTTLSGLDLMLKNNSEQSYSAMWRLLALLMYGQAMARCADRVHQALQHKTGRQAYKAIVKECSRCSKWTQPG